MGQACTEVWAIMAACMQNSPAQLGAASMPGQDAFGTIQEVVQIPAS